jgi:hypothetical protein
MMKAIAERPWIWIIVGCLFLLSGSIAMIVIASRHKPQEVPLELSHGR